MIKALIVLGFIALAANASTAQPVDGTFFDGLSQGLGLTSTQLDHSNTCFQGLETLFGQLQTLFVNAQQTPDVETVGMALLSFFQDAKIQVQQDCQDFVLDLVSVLTQNMQPSATGQAPDIEAIIHANLETYFPQLIQQIGELTNELVGGYEVEAGNTAAYIIQIIFGLKTPKATALPANVIGGTYVPFDIKKFIPKFFDSFFAVLGVKTTSRSLVICYNLVQTLSAENDKLVAELPQLDLFDRIDRTAAFYGKFVDTVKGCKDTFTAADLFIGRIIRTLSQNPSKYLYQIFLNTILQFPSVDQSIQTEIGYLYKGQYDLAGKTDALRVQAMFKGVINFATPEVAAV